MAGSQLLVSVVRTYYLASFGRLSTALFDEVLGYSLMKRFQLFEFEDLGWFPNSIRDSLTSMLSLLHKWFGSPAKIATILAEVICVTGRRSIVDLCSGDGALMIEVQKQLRGMEDVAEVKVELTDLYPKESARIRIASQGDQLLSYREKPLDASSFCDSSKTAIRTLISGFHHMEPANAKDILLSAMNAGDPILIYEISDNSFPPKYLWWIALLPNLFFGFFVAACVRPMTFRHFLSHSLFQSFHVASRGMGLFQTFARIRKTT